ncbi:hypothetical protein ABPG75_001788 [Micractinium tetrahymenae]
MAGSDWSSLTVVKLKEECKKRGLPVGGKKAELVERLEQHEGAEAPAAASAPAAEEQAEQAGEEEEEEEQPAEDEMAGEPEQEAEKEQPAVAEEAAPAADEEPAAEEPAAEEPAADEAAPAQEKEAEAQPMEAEEAAPVEEHAQAAAPEPAAMDQEHPAVGEAAAEVEPAADRSEQKEQPKEEQQPAQGTPAAGADVDLDYGEDSEGEGAAPAEEQPRGKAEEGPKRKRDEEPASAGNKRSAGAGATAAAVRAAAASGSEAAGGRPAKVPRSGSGFSLGNAEKGEALAPEDVPEASEPATRALRIDGFVRPFHERQVRELLGETGEVKALWMPSIKTHCYVVFETKAQAEATRRATYQLQWPATNPKRLAPRFVPLAEAETSIGNGAGNPDFRIKRTEEDGEEEAPPAAEAPAKVAADPKEAGKQAPDRSQREWNRNRRSPSPPPLEGVRDLREMLSRRHSGSAAPGAAAADTPRGRDLPPGLGALPVERREREREREAERRGSGGAPAPRQERVLTLDELFKKTASKPCIYWLPLTDEQVAEKKRKAAEATAAAAAAAEGSKPAENGTAAS